MKKITVHTLFLISLLLITACSKNTSVPPQHFVTWEGIGPDKWASVWLIKRKIDPNSKISFIPVTNKVKKGVAFDIPQAEIKRTNESTTYEKLVNTYNISDPIAAKLGRIIYDIEINSWGLKEVPESVVIETRFRELQNQYGREQVSMHCYLGFFDQVYDALQHGESADTIHVALSSLATDCGNSLAPSSANQQPHRLISELPIKTVLRFLATGDKVAFIDARETSEYEEYHIPGSVNMKLREVNAQSAIQFSDYDLVVPYCVKDFRGYELGRALHKEGINNVAIMNPFGIKGWRGLGLPVAGTTVLEESEAEKLLNLCLENIDKCLTNH